MWLINMSPIFGVHSLGKDNGWLSVQDMTLALHNYPKSNIAPTKEVKEVR